MGSHPLDSADMVIRLSGAVHRRAHPASKEEPQQSLLAATTPDPGTPLRNASYQHLRHASSSVDSLSSAGDEDAESTVHRLTYGPPAAAVMTQVPAVAVSAATTRRPSLLRARLTAAQAEAWQRFPHLELGYRPAGLSHAECVWSLFDPQLHNETFNVRKL